MQDFEGMGMGLRNPSMTLFSHLYNGDNNKPISSTWSAGHRLAVGRSGLSQQGDHCDPHGLIL